MSDRERGLYEFAMNGPDHLLVRLGWTSRPREAADAPSEEERRIIREAVTEIYGSTAVARLFGSRVDDSLRGGDIDLHIEADDVGQEPFPGRRDQLWARLQRRLGDRRIDIVQTRRGQAPRPIEASAYAQGLVL